MPLADLLRKTLETESPERWQHERTTIVLGRSPSNFMLLASPYVKQCSSLTEIVRIKRLDSGKNGWPTGVDLPMLTRC